MQIESALKLSGLKIFEPGIRGPGENIAGLPVVVMRHSI
jgi:hypothetical protein